MTGGNPMSAWAMRHGGDVQEALKKMGKMPLSQTGHGLAVPFPYVDKNTQYRAHVPPQVVEHAIANAPIGRVRLDEIHAIQHSVKPQVLTQYIEQPDAIPAGTTGPHGGPIDLPIVVRWRGRLLLHDGHHRATAAHLRGEKEIAARCVDMDKAAESLK